MTGVLVMAKQPVPGLAKTRLHPPLSLDQAARIAELCLLQTLETVDRLPFTRRTLVWEGEDPPVRTGWSVVPQAPGPFDERLAAALDDARGPTLLIGMDTPQLTAQSVAPVFGRDAWRTRAWFGPARDGGFWALGLAEPTGELVRGVPMSQDDTGARQLARLEAAGLSVGMLPELTDIDTIQDAWEVAAEVPDSAFARELGEMTAERKGAA